MVACPPRSFGLCRACQPIPAFIVRSAVRRCNDDTCLGIESALPPRPLPALLPQSARWAALSGAQCCTSWPTPGCLLNATHKREAAGALRLSGGGARENSGRYHRLPAWQGGGHMGLPCTRPVKRRGPNLPLIHRCASRETRAIPHRYLCCTQHRPLPSCELPCRRGPRSWITLRYRVGWQARQHRARRESAGARPRRRRSPGAGA